MRRFGLQLVEYDIALRGKEIVAVARLLKMKEDGRIRKVASPVKWPAGKINAVEKMCSVLITRCREYAE